MSESTKITDSCIHQDTGPSCSFRGTVGDLSHAHYHDILVRAINKGYCLSPVPTHPIDPKSMQLILRHDVDALPERSLHIAQIEAVLGARATYYIRIAANEYNPMSPTLLFLFEKIKRLGHDLGLHCESLDVASALNRDPIEVLNQHLEMFQKIFGPSSTISSHNDQTPLNNLRFLETSKATLCLKAQGLMEAYSSELGLFEHARYVTDSHPWYWRSFKAGQEMAKRLCLCDQLEMDDKIGAIYFLTHPHLWYAEHFQIRLD